MAKEKRKPARPAKDPNVLKKVKAAVASGNFWDVPHAVTRQLERSVTRPEYLYVLKNGYHEKRKDEYKEEHKAWNYAIRGKTLDGRELRVPISFDENGKLLIITVVENPR